MSETDTSLDTGGAVAPAPQTTTTVTYLVECEVVADDASRSYITRRMAGVLKTVALVAPTEDGATCTVRVLGAVECHGLADYQMSAAEVDIHQGRLRRAESFIASLLRARPPQIRKQYPLPRLVHEAGDVPITGLDPETIRYLAYEVGYHVGLSSMFAAMRPLYAPAEGA